VPHDRRGPDVPPVNTPFPIYHLVEEVGDRFTLVDQGTDLAPCRAISATAISDTPATTPALPGTGSRGCGVKPPPEGAETSADKRAATKAALRKLGFEPALIKAVPARDRMHSSADVSVCEEMPADFGR
jgi:hypothetical protein